MHFRSLLVISFLISGVFILTRCVNSEKQNEAIPPDAFKKYAGSQVCANCHRDIYNKHIHTEHHLTSAPATPTTILGSFEEGKNVFTFEHFVNVTSIKETADFTRSNTTMKLK